uniref:Solute carrier family 12 member 9 n=1 Tax=Lepeophtheirus salmonis TaxID=72036 RepID=A0A0K2T689_LEPSM
MSSDLDMLLSAEDEHVGRGSGGLGWFKGVFAPVSLSMFSSLLFLRVGYILGNAGILHSLLQIVIAYGILVFTILSVSAIATNGAVKGGGVYFMISRTLGPEFGGSIGVLFYAANIASSALYAVACTECIISSFGEESGTLAHYLPESFWYQILYRVLINLLNLSICLIGPNLFGKTTIMVLISVVFCTLTVITSFFSASTVEVHFNETISGSFTGILSKNWSIENFQSHLYPSYSLDCNDDTKPVNFAIVFAVLFSGVTGIMAGANLSGDLKEPSKSIPKGTLLASFFTFITYVILFTLTAMTCDKELLLRDCSYMIEFSFWKPFVIIGTVLATFCASTSCLIGSSRVLEAISKDTMFGIFLEWITYGTVGNNPVLAVVVTWLLSNIFFFIGGVNTIAQFVAVLFLLSYASVNLSCLSLDLASAPNFRPIFRCFSWYTCALGLIGTLTMMFMINPVISALVLFACIFFFLSLSFLSPTKENWGSISQALLFHQVRKYLLLLDSRKDHVKFWRPQVLLLVSNPRNHCSLIDFANALKKGGLYVLGHVREGNFEGMEEDECGLLMPHWLNLVDHLKVKAFVELTVAPTVRSGIQQLIRISGIGAMKPNTIIFGFPYEDENMCKDDLGSPTSEFFSDSLNSSFPALKKEISNLDYLKLDFIGILNDTLKLGKNFCVCRHFQNLNRGTVFSRSKTFYLNVWIDDFTPNSTNFRHNEQLTTTSVFMLQMACIVNMVPRWKKLNLRVFFCVDENEMHIGMKRQSLQNKLLNLRIKAEIVVVPIADNQIPPKSMNDGKMVNQLLSFHSHETAVTFLCLPLPPKDEDDETYLRFIKDLTNELPPTVLVHGISPVISTTL